MDTEAQNSVMKEELRKVRAEMEQIKAQGYQKDGKYVSGLYLVLRALKRSLRGSEGTSW